MPRKIDIAGQRFGLLVALEPVGRSQVGILWSCRCDCGQAAVLPVAKLRFGHTKSCGCLRAELLPARNRTHGKSSKKGGTYATWQSIRQRCLNPTCEYYPRYGGKGITLCERWNSYENFLADMGEKPAGTSIDRFPDMNGNYEPGNCRWGTPEQQSRNRRNVRLNMDLARQLRAEHAAGATGMDLIRKYGLSVSHVYRCLSGQTWREPPDGAPDASAGT